MKLEQLTPHVFYTPCDRRTDRPVLGYIQGEAISVMVDAGNSPAHVAGYLASLRGRPRPALCVVTHWHWDHTFGLEALSCPALATGETNRVLKTMAAWAWTPEAMAARLASGEEIPFADACIRAEYADPSAIHVVPAGMEWTPEGSVIDCGGVTCRVLPLPSAHSEGSLVVHIPEEKVLFIGDIYGDDYYQGHHRDIEKTRGLYRALEGLDFDTVLPGHDGPMPRVTLMGFLKQFI